MNISSSVGSLDAQIGHCGRRLRSAYSAFVMPVTFCSTARVCSPLEEPFFHQESVQTSLPEDTSLQTTSLAEELGGEGEVLLHDGDTFPGASPLDDSSLAFSIASPEPEAEAPAPAPNEESSWESYTNTTPTLKEDSLTTVDESGSLERKSLDTVSVLTEPKEETKEQILDGEESDETATPRDDPNADEPKVSERIEKEAQEKAKEAEPPACGRHLSSSASRLQAGGQPRSLTEASAAATQRSPQTRRARAHPIDSR